MSHLLEDWMIDHLINGANFLPQKECSHDFFIYFLFYWFNLKIGGTIFGKMTTPNQSLV